MTLQGSRLVAFALVVLVGTGAYVRAPWLAYLTVGAGVLALLARPGFARHPFGDLPAAPLSGFLLYNALFLVHSAATVTDPATLLVRIVSIGTFLVTLASWNAALSRRADGSPAGDATLAAVVALAVLLAAQVFEALGIIERRVGGLDEEAAAFAHRPGGFMNPNTAAATALVLLHATVRARAGAVALACASVLAAAVAGLSQSRAVLPLLALYLLVGARRRPALVAPWLVALPVLLAWADRALIDAVVEPVAAAVARFSGAEESSLERGALLQRALWAIDDAPWLGHGWGYLVRVTNFSSHNEVIEHMVHFGALSLPLFGLAFALLYLPVSPWFALLALVPMTAFSHNFFDTTSFQAALGLAFALERRHAASVSGRRVARAGPRARAARPSPGPAAGAPA
jgi:hypothetical protein